MTSPTVSVPHRMPGIRGQKGASRSDGVSSMSGIPVARPACGRAHGRQRFGARGVAVPSDRVAAGFCALSGYGDATSPLRLFARG